MTAPIRTIVGSISKYSATPAQTPPMGPSWGRRTMRLVPVEERSGPVSVVMGRSIGPEPSNHNRGSP
jgi:hypothetical protein